MATGVYFSILGQVRDTVAALGLSGVDSSSVKVRMLPLVRQTLDTLPCVLVAPSETPEEPTPLSFEDDAAYQVVYGVDVVQVSANGGDYSTELETYLRRSEQVRRAFGQPLLANVPEVFDVSLRPFVPLDRSRLNELYAYSGLTLLVSVVEPREDD